MGRFRLPAMLSSVAVAAAILVIIVTQSAFTFSAVLESLHITRETTSRESTVLQIRSLETALYRQRLAERAYLVKPSAIFASERIAANREFRRTLHGLLSQAAPARAAQLRRIDEQVIAYARAGSWMLSRIDAGEMRTALLLEEGSVEPRYAELSSALLDLIASYSARTSELDARGLRLQEGLKYGALAVLLAGVLCIAVLLAMLEMYRRRAERALAARVETLQATLRTDALTGIPNDRAFHESLTEAQSARGALLLIDIDDFKAVNDARGRAYGDRLIERLGTALQKTANGASLYRIAGDRFAMFWEIRDGVRARPMAEDAWRAATQTLGGITVSAGYREAAGHGADGEPDLLESAQAALRRAKRKGGDTFLEFSELEPGLFVFSRGKAQAVRRILRERRMSMSFQPIVETVGGRVIAYEALARPQKSSGLSGPDEMFDVAERLYKHFELDDVCVRSALRSAEKRPDALIFLNVVPASLESDRLNIEQCMSDMTKTGCAPQTVVLELTERKIGNVNALAARIEELRSRGFRVALDDTGAGSAGLEVLSKMTFDFVKIDRSLLIRAMNDRRARGVLSGVLAIAHETGSTVIAEGIETPEMAAFAREFQARSVTTAIGALQGHFFGMPGALTIA